MSLKYHSSVQLDCIFFLLNLNMCEYEGLLKVGELHWVVGELIVQIVVAIKV